MKKFILLLSIASCLVLTTSVASAGQITLSNLQVVDGASAPVVSITHTNPDGTGSISEGGVYANPQVSGGTSSPLLYCVDLWHDNDIGSTYNLDSVSSLAFASSTYADVDNRIGYLLTQNQSTVDARAAVQLAIWATIDNAGSGFSYTGGDSTLNSEYNALLTFSNYHPNLDYGAQFYQAATSNQNVAIASASSPNFLTVPEPSTLVLAVLGAVCVAGLCRAQRRA